MQGKEQEDATSCKGDDKEKPKKKNKKTTSKTENGNQEKTTRKKKMKVIRDAKSEKIKSPNWSHLRILGC